MCWGCARGGGKIYGVEGRWDVGVFRAEEGDGEERLWLGFVPDECVL